MFKIEHSETLFVVFLEPKKQFPRQGWSSLKFSSKRKLKTYDKNDLKAIPLNIGIRVPGMEWETTGLKGLPPASNESVVNRI